MDIEEHRIREIDNLIQYCIDGDSDGGSDFLKPLDSLIEKLTFGEIEELINHFKKMNKYHHVGVVARVWVGLITEHFVSSPDFPDAA
ncbi:MAG: hypothetical protein GY789_29215 [Hyphomicrobiales bacterium]|nr:hypothetical protein [Hyphomicrobiales bacterium]